MSLILYQTKYYNNTINLEIASNSLVLVHFFLCVCPRIPFYLRIYHTDCIDNDKASLQYVYILIWALRKPCT